MGRDRREDEGQYYPGGRVIPITPQQGGGSMVLDDTVTQSSSNGVKSSGIWTWVKSLLPSWLTSSREEPPTQASVAAKYTKPGDGIPLSDLKPSTFPPEAHAHTNDSWFTTAIYAVKSWASGAFAALSHSHVGDSWFTSALAEKVPWANEAHNAVTIGSRASGSAIGDNSLAQGENVKATGYHTHAEGVSTHAEGDNTHAEGSLTHAEGNSTHAEGSLTHAEGNSTHAEGSLTHAEGDNTHAEGSYTHAEGYGTHAEGDNTHAEGDNTHAEGSYTHAEGYSTHAEGGSTTAGKSSGNRGRYAHAAGFNAQATNTTAFTWNGSAKDNPSASPESPSYVPPYSDHGNGTYNLNPVGGPAGLWIGDATLADLLNAKASISDILQLCQPFSATKTGGYAVGDFCSYLDGGTLKLYQCTTAHTGAWNAAHFAERDVSSLFSTVNTSTDPQPSGLLNNAALDKAIVKVASTVSPTDVAKSGAVAAAFSTSKTYAVDEVVMHDRLLYRCTTAVTTAGAWDSAKWTAVAATDSDTAFLKDSQGHLVIKKTAGQKNTLYVDAYRMVSLTAAGTKALKDASVNDCGTIAANDVLALPPAIDGYCRDLIVILQTPATLPTFTFPLATTDLEPWSDALPTWAASTVYRIYLSETRSGKWEIHTASKGVTA